VRRCEPNDPASDDGYVEVIHTGSQPTDVGES
jgi:hypothetical protein